MKSSAELQTLLRQIDHKSYPAYKDTRGKYQFGQYILSIDHVQGDPFAAPSKVSILVAGRTAAFDKGCYETKHRRIAFQDYLLRRMAAKVKDYSFKAKGSGKSGLLGVSQPGQEILERSACTVEPASGDITIRMEVGFPANGRTINSGELVKILFDFLPVCVRQTLLASSCKKEVLEGVLYLADDQQYIREQLPTRGLAAFVADGAILPRKAARLINAYCTDEARAGLLSELREMADGYKALCGMYRQKMEELLEEPAAYRHWRAQFNKTEVLHRRMENNIKLISGGKKG